MKHEDTVEAFDIEEARENLKRRKERTAKEREKLFVQFWKAYARHFKDKGWFDVAYYNGVDEAYSPQTRNMARIYQLEQIF